MNLSDFNPSFGAQERAVSAIVGFAAGIGAQVYKADAQSQYSTAVTTINNAYAEFDQALQQDPNWQEYDSKLAKMQSDLWGKISSDVTNPLAMSKVQSAFADASAQHRQAIDKTANTMRIQSGISDLQNNINNVMSSKLYTDAQKRTEIGQLIDGAKSVNLIDPLQSDKLNEQYNNALDIQEVEAQAFALGRNGPQWILDPQNTPKLTDAERKQVSGAVEAHMNAVDKANATRDEQISAQVTNEILQGKVTDPTYFSRLGFQGPNKRTLTENLYNFWKTAQGTADNAPEDESVKKAMWLELLSNDASPQKLKTVTDALSAGAININSARTAGTFALSFPQNGGVAVATDEGKKTINAAIKAGTLSGSEGSNALIQLSQIAADPNAKAQDIITAAENIARKATDAKVAQNLSSNEKVFGEKIPLIGGWFKNAMTGNEKIFSDMQSGKYVGTLSDPRYTEFYQSMKLSVTQAAAKSFPDEIGNMSVNASTATSIPIVTVKDYQGNTKELLTVRYDEQSKIDKWYKWTPSQITGDPVKDQLNPVNWTPYGMIK